MDRSQQSNIVQRILTWISNFMAIIAGVAMVAMLIVSGGDILGRTLFGLPIEGSSVIISELLFPVCVFFSLPYVARIGGHIRVDFCDRLLSSVARPRAILFGLLSALFWGLIAWKAGGRAWEAFSLGQRPIGAVGIPAAYSYGVVMLGAGVAAISHLAWVSKSDKNSEH